jgi:hypothetical protein
MSRRRREAPAPCGQAWRRLRAGRMLRLRRAVRGIVRALSTWTIDLLRRCRFSATDLQHTRDLRRSREVPVLIRIPNCLVRPYRKRAVLRRELLTKQGASPPPAADVNVAVNAATPADKWNAGAERRVSVMPQRVIFRRSIIHQCLRMPARPWRPPARIRFSEVFAPNATSHWKVCKLGEEGRERMSGT